jgi:hypothetical protein
MSIKLAAANDLVVFIAIVSRGLGEQEMCPFGASRGAAVSGMQYFVMRAKIAVAALLLFAWAALRGVPPMQAVRRSYFAQELLRTDRPQTAFVLAISSALVNWLGVLLAIIPIVLLWRDRYRIADAVRARVATATPVET